MMLNATQYWQAYLSSLDNAQRCLVEQHKLNTFSFGTESDRLLLSVLAGDKTATCSLYVAYQFENEPLPQAGEFNLILDSRHYPLVITRTTQVDILAMNDVPEDFALAEGEGDYTAWWQQHKQFFTQQLQQYGLSWQEDIVLVCERFQLIDINPLSYQEWLQSAVFFLQKNKEHNPYLEPKRDAMVLLQQVTQKSNAHLLAFGETKLTATQLQRLYQYLLRRYNGEPIAYILAEKDFWSLNLEVSPCTLIPRPDTECLVERAITLALAHLPLLDAQTYRILDLGTGTGAIALALSSSLTIQAENMGKNLDIIGVDCVAEAVALAQRNAVRNHITNVTFLQSHWFSALSDQDKFHLIVSNPPYIDEQDNHLLQGDVRFEPRSALVAEQQGYQDIELIIKQASRFLTIGGYLIIEHGWQQAEKVRYFFQQNNWQNIATLQDYSGLDRITLAQYGVAGKSASQ